MKTIIIFAGFITVLFFSCKKADSNTNKNLNCLLQTITNPDNSFTEKVNYNSNYEVISIEENGANFTSIVPFKDASNRISKIDYYQGSHLANETIYQFDGGNRIKLISFYQNGILLGYINWIYTSGDRPTQTNEYDINNGNTTLTQTLNYTYDERGNVLTADYDSYTYDHNLNANRALNFLPTPLAGNANNITSHSSVDQNQNPITSSSTYTYDDNGNVILRKDIDYYGVSSVYNYSFLCH